MTNNLPIKLSNEEFEAKVTSIWLYGHTPTAQEVQNFSPYPYIVTKRVLNTIIEKLEQNRRSSASIEEYMHDMYLELLA